MNIPDQHCLHFDKPQSKFLLIQMTFFLPPNNNPFSIQQILQLFSAHKDIKKKKFGKFHPFAIFPFSINFKLTYRRTHMETLSVRSKSKDTKRRKKAENPDGTFLSIFLFGRKSFSFRSFSFKLCEIREQKTHKLIDDLN
jgi:hypothetical protein